MAGDRLYQEIDIRLIEPDPDQPRRDINPSALRELADSIAAMGIEQPINVRKHPGKSDRFMIISGERRWRAAGLVGLTSIPAIVRAEMELDDLRRRQMAENYHRENFNPVEEAEFLQKWIDSLKAKEVESPHTVVASSLGISPSTLSKKLQVLKFDAEVRALVRDGLIRDNTALRTLSSLDKKDRQLVIAKAKTGDFNFKEFRKNQPKILRSLRAERTASATPATAHQQLAAMKYLRWHFTRDTLLKLMTATDFRHHLADIDLSTVSDDTMSSLFEQFKDWVGTRP